MEKNTISVESDKLDEIIALIKKGVFSKQKATSTELEFPSDHDKKFIKDSVEVVLNKLCPNYPIKERSGYFELGHFFVLIELHNSKNHLIVGMKTDHSMRRELMELSFVFTETGDFEITDYPDHAINNLVFKFFIELKKEIERRRLVKARSGKFQKIFQKWRERLSTKDSFILS